MWIVPSGGVIEYLAEHEADSLCSLYADAFTTLAVFRSLPALGKQFVMRLLCLAVDQGVPMQMVNAWSREEARAQHRAALERMKRLRLAKVTSEAYFQLDPQFHGCMRQALSGRLNDPDQHELPQDKHPPTMEELVDGAENAWESLLHFIVGSDMFKHRKPSEDVQRLLCSMGLMAEKQSGNGYQITSDGFKFLFKNLHTQLWTVLIGYMANLEQRKMNRNEVLSFLFRLGFLELGKDYPIASLTDSQQQLVTDLCHFGLIFRRKPNSRRFYPTALAINLSSGSRLHSRNKHVEGYITVETTFKLYAYTDSPLQMALLSMFSMLDVRLPNLVVGRITKRSVRRALRIGIAAHEVVSFLEEYAHDEVKKASPEHPLPANVADQIRLWEGEKKRLDFRMGILLKHFATADEYEEIKKLLELDDHIIWCCDDKNYIFTTKQGVIVVKNYLATKRAT